MVDGEGGGRWMILCGSEPLRTVPSLIPKPDCCGDPEAASSSDASEGICRLSFGRAAPDLEPLVFVLEGGANSGVPESRGTGCGAGRGLTGAVTLRGGGRISFCCCSCFICCRGGSFPKLKCLARTDPPSSIGVKILRDFEDMCFGCGGLIV